MALLVQKFGGTSVGDVDRIRNVARRVAASRQRGDGVVVVVSAMAGETDRLLALGRSVTPQGDGREMDQLVATGEQVSVALVAMALHALGVPARSLLGLQVPVRTDGAFGRARITEVGTAQLRALLDEGIVPVVAGFQGVGPDGSVTTLGRGGSDTSAVALAAAMRADVCEIYTDVDGVYTADPAICSNARKIPRISYEEMLELASLGAKVLQTRSVELAMKYGVAVHVRSSFSDGEGTWVVGEESALESVVVAGVTADRNVAKLAVRAVPDRPGVCAALFEPLAAAGICVDMIIQNVSVDGTTDLTFTVPRADLLRARTIAERVVSEIGARAVHAEESVAKVSIVGLGMRSHAGVAARMFRLLAAEGINIEAISTSEIKVSCLVRDRYLELAVRALHDGFGLGRDAPETDAERA
ncbi:MAG: aspartate kinase [Myxococcota bacterium]|nr:aspartate kinase [Myxococcota bacterium]